MATVYSSPEELNEFKPKFDFANFNRKEHMEKEKAYLEKLQEWCKNNGSGPYAGESFKVPMADSYAHYMVISLRPCQVINVPLGDEWHDSAVSQYSASYIKGLIDSDKKFQKALEKMKQKKS